jgi:hypothetical protein
MRLACLIIIASGLLAACAAAPSPAPVLSPSPTPAVTPAPAPSVSPRPTDGCGSADISIDYLPYTVATLAGYGWSFVVADVVGFEPAIFNTPDGDAPPGFPERPSSPHPNPNAEAMVYTPVDVVIDRAISGPWSPGPSQFLIEGGTVFLEGGAVDCFVMRVYPAPHVEPGASYVFILSDALDADGQKPLPVPKARFAWIVGPGGMVQTVDGPMSIDELTEIVSGATALPSLDIQQP